jgi:ComF family protein
LSNLPAAGFDSVLRSLVAGASTLLAAALPVRCLLCHDASGATLLCAPCMHSLPALPLACPRCALPSPDARVCGRCLAKLPPFAATLAPLVYAFPVDRLVQALKYSHQIAVAVPLAEALAAAVQRLPAESPRPELIVPMPLSRARQRGRGFNQSAEIARLLARRSGIAIAHLLARPLDTPAQAGLPWRERQRNVRGAFVARGIVGGRHVAIVDDVMTTGATMQAAATALLAAGAARVEAWVVARALPPGSA